MKMLIVSLSLILLSGYARGEGSGYIYGNGGLNTFTYSAPSQDGSGYGSISGRDGITTFQYNAGPQPEPQLKPYVFPQQNTFQQQPTQQWGNGIKTFGGFNN